MYSPFVSRDHDAGQLGAGVGERDVGAGDDGAGGVRHPADDRAGHGLGRTRTMGRERRARTGSTGIHRRHQGVLPLFMTPPSAASGIRTRIAGPENRRIAVYQMRTVIYHMRRPTRKRSVSVGTLRMPLLTPAARGPRHQTKQAFVYRHAPSGLALVRIPARRTAGHR